MNATPSDVALAFRRSSAPAGRGTWIALVSLSLLCAAFYCYGLTTHGLRNWQEGQRALVAREMFRAGEWITPTVHGTPYIAKPPLMYWASMVIGHARRALGFQPFSDETEVRLTVAIAATIGVLATFIVARRLLAPDHPDADESRFAHRAAWWSALGLASGILYFRSARVGELDVLIVPFVVIAIGAVDALRRRMELQGRTHYSALLVATLAGVGATMTKGPPALLMIALAGYGPIVLRAVGACSATEASRRVGIVAAAGLACLFVAIPIREIEGLRSMLGLLCMGFMGALIGGWTGRLARPGALWAIARALHRTHPMAALGIPLVVLWGWGQLVTMDLGTQVVSELARIEVENNLRLFHLESPVKNLGFFLYGVAPISIASLAGMAWVLREKPSFRTAPGRWTPFVWCALSFIAFSLLGKGVARYLTPAWPGVAMVGGLWIAAWLRSQVQSGRSPMPRAVVVSAVLLCAGVGQAWWYGAGREMHLGERTPREFVREVRPLTRPGRVGTYELSAPALDYYFDEQVVRWERSPRDPARSVAALIRSSLEDEYVLVTRRETPVVTRRFGSVLDALRAAGLTAEEIPTRSVFLRPEEDATVVAYRIVPPR